MEIVKTILIIVLILVLIGILYNASRLYHKLYHVTYKSTKNPALRAIKSGFRSITFAIVNLMGITEPYDG